MGLRVYIMSPYTKGDVGFNVNKVLIVADLLVDRGHTPFIPHLTHFWHIMSPKEYEFWLEYDLSFLRHWAEVGLRLKGESHGADKEVEECRKLGIPVFTMDNFPWCTRDITPWCTSDTET